MLTVSRERADPCLLMLYPAQLMVVLFIMFS